MINNLNISIALKANGCISEILKFAVKSIESESNTPQIQGLLQNLLIFCGR